MLCIFLPTGRQSIDNNIRKALRRHAVGRKTGHAALSIGDERWKISSTQRHEMSGSMWVVDLASTNMKSRTSYTLLAAALLGVAWYSQTIEAAMPTSTYRDIAQSRQCTTDGGGHGLSLRHFEAV